MGDKATPETRTHGTVTPDVTIGFDCVSVNQIPFVECNALVALYDSTGGPSWVDNSGWLATITPCTWSGIECTGDHVSGIDLGYNHLAGIIPSELGDLSHLRALSLPANQLYGPIPAKVGNLSELIALEMSGNQLTGPLPEELGNLQELRTLSLNNNQLSGPIPSALGNIRSLQSLGLSHNQFNSAIPTELGNLANLNILYLSHNKLSGAIPAALGKLSKLDELDLSYNQLSGIVPESVTRIVQRSLWGNKLEGTVTSSDQEPIVVDYEGVHFSVDSSLATSIWPEIIPATPALEALEGPSFWNATPEHLRFTFADPDLSPGRRRMGLSLAAEAQILVYPMAKLADINPLVHTRIDTLQNLLTEAGTVPAGELPLLPVINSAQVFHAQVQRLAFGNIKGLRFISQHSQDPRPIMLSQELFYTFQGFTDNDTYYVAAFFPVTTAALPATITDEAWTIINGTEASYTTYLAETAGVLDRLSPAEFTPDLKLLDAVITSLQVEPDGALLR